MGLSFFTGSISNRGGHNTNKHAQSGLVDAMRSSVKRIVKDAIDELRANSWLTDGSLRGVNFSRSRLQGAGLAKADFRRCDFRSARLDHASIQKADFTDSDLRWVTLNHTLGIQAVFKSARMMQSKLRSATLTGADFRNADLRQADFTNADLSMSDLRGADLYKANLRGVSLNHPQVVIKGARRQRVTRGKPYHRQAGSAKLDGTTRLPDGSYYQPSEGLDQMSRFTD